MPVEIGLPGAKNILIEVELKDKSWHDILTGKLFKSPNGILSLNLKPYYVLWLKTSLAAQRKAAWDMSGQVTI
ncbi:MAG: hypothetical protein JRJ27_19870 [Deltaproteobacteria bacterium]|nr:hypothetical protein [Deltaproteobacteria bacterium]